MEIHGVKAYKQIELAKMDGRHPLTIKNNYKYIPIYFENWQTRSSYKKWFSTTPYSVRYIRLDDLKDYMIDQHNKKIVVEKSE